MFGYVIFSFRGTGWEADGRKDWFAA